MGNFISMTSRLSIKHLLFDLVYVIIIVFVYSMLNKIIAQLGISPLSTMARCPRAHR